MRNLKTRTRTQTSNSQRCAVHGRVRTVNTVHRLGRAWELARCFRPTARGRRVPVHSLNINFSYVTGRAGLTYSRKRHRAVSGRADTSVDKPPAKNISASIRRPCFALWIRTRPLTMRSGTTPRHRRSNFSVFVVRTARSAPCPQYPPFDVCR